MLLKLVTCNNHVPIRSNKGLLLKVVLFLTGEYQDTLERTCLVGEYGMERLCLAANVWMLNQASNWLELHAPYTAQSAYRQAERHN